MKAVHIVVASLVLVACLPAAAQAPIPEPEACSATQSIPPPAMPRSGGNPLTPPPEGALLTPARLATPSPDFSASATRCRHKGPVSVRFCISESGKAGSLQVMEPNIVAEAALVKAVTDWITSAQHVPGTVNGAPATFCGVTELVRLKPQPPQ